MDYEYCGYEIQVEHVRGDIFAFVWRPGSKLEWGPPVLIDIAELSRRQGRPCEAIVDSNIASSIRAPRRPISKGVGTLLDLAKIRIREDMKNRRQLASIPQGLDARL
jgi:hypothetical protein